jgi:nitroimidazol reductase NimA-like FMN-containing flavoprotein (pyridoxamine 5'-phosphate oxidase superfamily)
MISLAPHALDSAGWRILDRDECLGLLMGCGLGRVAINVRALPAILPVHFALHRDEVVLRVGAGSTLDRATRDEVVAFEADGIAEGGGYWSVTLTGVARQLANGFEPEWADALPLPCWPTSRPHHLVVVSTDHMSGRRTPRIGPDWASAQACPSSTSR